MDDFLIKWATAKGKRISNRVVRRVTNITGRPQKAKPVPAVLPGLKSPSQQQASKQKTGRSNSGGE
jgi:topoisomerase-4 subunit A